MGSAYWDYDGVLALVADFAGIAVENIVVRRHVVLGQSRHEFDVTYQSGVHDEAIDVKWIAEISEDADHDGERYVDKSRCVRLEVTRG